MSSQKAAHSPRKCQIIIQQKSEYQQMHVIHCTNGFIIITGQFRAEIAAQPWKYSLKNIKIYAVFWVTCMEIKVFLSKFELK